MISTCLKRNKEVIIQLLRKVLIPLQPECPGNICLLFEMVSKYLGKKKTNKPNPHIQITWEEYELS